MAVSPSPPSDPTRTAFSIDPALQKWTSHEREHGLISEAHQREHDNLMREVGEKAKALEDRVRETAQALAKQFADTTVTLENRVREVAELHWNNHRVEHDGDQRAVDKVERNMVDKFESVNEFRNQQKDIIAGFLPRAEYDGAHKAVVDRVDQLRLTASTHITREEFGLALAQIGTLRDELSKFREREGGKKEGAAPYTAIIFAVIGSVLSALATGAIVIATRTPTP